MSTSFRNLRARSLRASRAARGSSRKTDTTPEVRLRRALWKQGLRYLKNVADLPDRPDIVFSRQKLAVFVDGDYWHGNNWSWRKAKLANGHNAEYWIAKIERNRDRDSEVNDVLQRMGWTVVRV